MTVPLTLHPDRLFPVDPATRALARSLYDTVKDLPILSPHGHVPPAWIAEDTPFSDPTNLLLTPDHYVNRVLHGQGVDLADLGVPMGRPDFTADQARNAWRIFCRHWHLYRGTPMKFWMEAELHDIFGVRVRPSEETADEIYDAIAAAIATPEFTPRALMHRFNIQFLATTDDPCDSLEHHATIRDTFDVPVRPTFRPDRYCEPLRADWPELMGSLAEASGEPTDTWAGFRRAMEHRRAFFKGMGAVSTDHSHADLGTQPLSDADASAVYARALRGEASEDECTALRRTMVFDQARMASEDGLVMTLHPAVARNHHRPTFERYGADVGGDIPKPIEVVESLKPMLNAFGTNPNFTVVLFGMDETVYSREVGPLAGFYPSVYVGPPWWFIDAPDAIKRWRKAVTEYGTFYKTCGFIDDTRAFLSIPARHDLSRRCDVAHLAELVAEGRLEMDEAAEVAHALVVEQPRRVFKIPDAVS